MMLLSASERVLAEMLNPMMIKKKTKPTPERMREMVILEFTLAVMPLLLILSVFSLRVKHLAFISRGFLKTKHEWCG